MRYSYEHGVANFEIGDLELDVEVESKEEAENIYELIVEGWAVGYRAGFGSAVDEVMESLEEMEAPKLEVER